MRKFFINNFGEREFHPFIEEFLESRPDELICCLELVLKKSDNELYKKDGNSKNEENNICKFIAHRKFDSWDNCTVHEMCREVCDCMVLEIVENIEED